MITTDAPVRQDGRLVPGDPARFAAQLQSPLPEGAVVTLHLTAAGTSTATDGPEVLAVPMEADGLLLSVTLTVEQVGDVVGDASGFAWSRYRITAGSGDDLVALFAGVLRVTSQWEGAAPHGVALLAGVSEAQAARISASAAEAARMAAEGSASAADGSASTAATAATAAAQAAVAPISAVLDGRLSEESLSSTYVAGDDLAAADGSTGYSPYWRDAWVSPSPLDRVPIITPTLGSEGAFVQEPQVWQYGGLLHMIYTGGLPERLHYASCPVTSDPLIPASWTKTGIVLGGGVGGEAGTAYHSGVYVEGSTLYVYYAAPGGNLDVATASLDTPTALTRVGTVLTMAASGGATITLANPHMVKLAASSYRLYFEGGGTLPLWQIGTATGTDPAGAFGAAAFPLAGLAVNPGKSTSSNPFVVKELDGTWAMWFHGAWGEYQRGTGSPTVGYVATSPDGLAWTVAHDGLPTIRLAHPYEVDQVADLSLLAVGAERYAFWAANTAYGGSDRLGRIMATRVRRPLSRRIGGTIHPQEGTRPTGPKLPTRYGESRTVNPTTFTTTTVGSEVLVDAISFADVALPDTVRVNWGACLNISSSVAAYITINIRISSSKPLVNGQATVGTAFNVTPGAITAVPLNGSFTVRAGSTWSVKVFVKNGAGAATTTVYTSSTSWVDTAPV